MSKDWDAVARELFREVVECDAPREAFVATFKAALETAYEQGRENEREEHICTPCQCWAER